MEELQGIIGNRALGQLIKSQPDLYRQVHRSQDPLLSSVSPVSGQPIQRMPRFRGLSHELMGHWQQGNPVQAKLTIGEAGDKYEQEADRVASEVVDRINTPVSSLSTQPDSIQPQQEQDELMRKPMVQLDSVEGGIAATPELESSIQQARGSGIPIAESIRKPMEQSFGADFSGVRVHSDTQSDQLNQSIQARAFTTGKDIFFRQGEYNPGSRGGQELIAHELTHVVQQTGSTVKRSQRQKTGRVFDEVQPLSSPVIQRAPVWKLWADTSFHSFVSALDKLVNHWAAEILKNPLGIPDVDGYTKRWIALVTSFTDTYKMSGSLHDALKKEPFIYASYGYAVESLTNFSMKRRELDTDLPRGMKIALQATRGHTRPDLVIKEQLTDKDIAWFDITASGSEAHIDQKTGSGWSNRSYVAEVTYPSLTDKSLEELADAVLKNHLSPQELEDLKKLVEAHKFEQDKQLNKAADLVKQAVDSVQYQTNMTNRRKEFETKMAQLLGDGRGKLSPQDAKGWIALVHSKFDYSYARLAAEAGYTRNTATGRNTERAASIIYSL